MLAAHIVSGQQRCADCKSLIHVSPWSSTKGQRPQTPAIFNVESAVRPHLNATLYHGTNLYDKMMTNCSSLTNCSSSSNDPVISCDNIQINLSNIFSQFSRMKFSTRKPKEYYPHQFVDSKNSADLRQQVDASADHTSLPDWHTRITQCRSPV